MRNYCRLFLAALIVLTLTLGVTALTATPAAADVPVVHVVSWGDTLYSLANRYGTSVHAIMQANNLRNPDFIFIGQRLVIPGSSGSSTATTYVVQSGDTLFSIATRHGTTVAALMQANKLYSYWIYVGQVLKVPGRAPQLSIPVPLPAPAPAPQGVYHIVHPGEYLAYIATRYRTTPYTIQIANKISNPSFLWVGERLFIPGGETPVTQPSYSPLQPIYVPPFVNPPLVVNPPVVQPQVMPLPVPVAPLPEPPTPIPVIVIPSAPVVSPTGTGWEAVLLSNTIGNGPCSLAVTVVGKTDWPVVVATTDGSWISDPKYTGTKPERGPYVVEFAHACVGVWRVIPLGLNIYADIELKGGHAEVEFHAH